MPLLTEEDKSDIVYFWQEKGDLTRWCGWERAKPAVAQEYPEIIKAWEEYRAAVRTLNIVVKHLADELEAGLP